MAFPRAATISGDGKGPSRGAAPKPSAGRTPMSKKAAIGARETPKKNPFAQRAMRGRR
jgi:hypothetical protein